jgi:hypothetical protein
LCADLLGERVHHLVHAIVLRAIPPHEEPGKPLRFCAHRSGCISFIFVFLFAFPSCIAFSREIFPKELVFPYRQIAEYYYNIVRWTKYPSGGHFAALEEPELLVGDIRAFVSSLQQVRFSLSLSLYFRGFS